MPGVHMSGGGKRHIDDFYETPDEATFAFMLKCEQWIGPVVHEPACGTGRMARVIEIFGRTVIATDLVDRGYGQPGIDYLKGPPRAKSVVTNPPFKHAKAFIEHTLAHDPEFFGLLLKATFWNADDRFELNDKYPPKLTLPLTWRLDWTGGGAPTMDCTWFAWGSAIPAGLPPMSLRRPSLGVFA